MHKSWRGMAKRIRWQYTHHLNSTNTVQRVKKGKYFGLVKHTMRHWSKRYSDQMAVVKFDGNKRTSHVPYHELQFTRGGKA